MSAYLVPIPYTFSTILLIFINQCLLPNFHENKSFCSKLRESTQYIYIYYIHIHIYTYTTFIYDI